MYTGRLSFIVFVVDNEDKFKYPQRSFFKYNKVDKIMCVFYFC